MEGVGGVDWDGRLPAVVGHRGRERQAGVGVRQENGWLLPYGRTPVSLQAEPAGLLFYFSTPNETRTLDKAQLVVYVLISQQLIAPCRRQWILRRPSGGLRWPWWWWNRD